MGVSTNAVLVFGIDIGEDLPEFLEDFDGDFDDFLADYSGLPKWGEEGHDFDKTVAWNNDFPVELVQHCSYEYPMYILAVRGTESTARRGYAAEIDVASMQIDNVKILQLKNFCEQYNIEWQEPKWLLCSMWG